jgi:hypothetical protein
MKHEEASVVETYHVRVDGGLITRGGKRQRRSEFDQTGGRRRLGQSRGQWGSSVVRLQVQAGELRLDEGKPVVVAPCRETAKRQARLVVAWCSSWLLAAAR